MAVTRKKKLLLTGRKKIKIRLTMQLIDEGIAAKCILTLPLFLQQVFSKTVAKTFTAERIIAHC